MIQTVSIKETRDNLAELVERVAEQGEEFVVTRFGKAKAKLVPVDEEGNSGKGDFDEVFGVWKQRKDIDNTALWVKKIRAKSSLRIKDE